MTKKFIPINEVKEISDSVLVYGHFSTIHPGHIRYLRNASKKAKNLVVLLIGDNVNNQKYPFYQNERAEGLSSIEFITNIVLLDGVELSLAIKKIKPSFFLKEFKYKRPYHIICCKTMKESGGKVEFHAGLINYANSDLLMDSTETLQIKNFQIEKACHRQGLSLNDLLKAVDKLRII